MDDYYNIVYQLFIDEIHSCGTGMDGHNYQLLSITWRQQNYQLLELLVNADLPAKTRTKIGQ